MCGGLRSDMPLPPPPPPLPPLRHVAQDTFSVGCVIAELFLDGRALFDLSQLLQYKKRQLEPASLLSGLDPALRALVLHMINLDPGGCLPACPACLPALPAGTTNHLIAVTKACRATDSTLTHNSTH